MIWPMSSHQKGCEKIRMFTYYIPAPPTRRSGYREKEFDKLMAEIFELGFNLKSLTTQAHTGQDSSGIWVLCQLSGDKSLDWGKLDELADPLPKEKEDYDHGNTSLQAQLVNSDKMVDLPEMTEEEAKKQLADLYTIDEDEKGQKVERP